jgi:hypothetical protein
MLAIAHKDSKTEGRYIEKDEELPEGFVVNKRSRYKKDYLTLKEYIEREDVLVIYKDDIRPSEREGTVPTQGYVWQD